MVHGTTLHRLFRLPIERGGPTMFKPLTGMFKEMETKKWRSVRWVVVDEVSMVSYQVLRQIHMRLGELKGGDDADHPFGNVNIIFFGDLMQLPPVKGNWIFDQPLHYSAEIHLWRLFTLLELTENMRQREDQEFVNFLNALRMGTLTIEDLEILYRRTVPHVDLAQPPFADSVRIFPTNRQVDCYNQERSNALKETLQGGLQKMYFIKAEDKYSDESVNDYGEPANERHIPSDVNKCAGLPHSIELAVGSRVMLRRNIDLDDGLVNGVLGTVEKIVFPCLRRDQSFVGEIPDSILIKFDDPRIGRYHRQGQDGVIIRPVEVDYTGNYGRKIDRRMLPLILAWACTTHKMQGVTLDAAVLDCSSKNFQQGQLYVALSRVRSLNGIAISDICAARLLNNPHSRKALAEMNRMRDSS